MSDEEEKAKTSMAEIMKASEELSKNAYTQPYQSTTEVRAKIVFFIAAAAILWCTGLETNFLKLNGNQFLIIFIAMFLVLYVTSLFWVSYCRDQKQRRLLFSIHIKPLRKWIKYYLSEANNDHIDMINKLQAEEKFDLLLESSSRKRKICGIYTDILANMITVWETELNRFYITELSPILFIAAGACILLLTKMAFLIQSI